MVKKKHIGLDFNSRDDELEEALALLHRACELKFADALTDMGRIYEDGLKSTAHNDTCKHYNIIEGL